MASLHLGLGVVLLPRSTNLHLFVITGRTAKTQQLLGHNASLNINSTLAVEDMVTNEQVSQENNAILMAWLTKAMMGVITGLFFSEPVVQIVRFFLAPLCIARFGDEYTRLKEQEMRHNIEVQVNEDGSKRVIRVMSTDTDVEGDEETGSVDAGKLEEDVKVGGHARMVKLFNTMFLVLAEFVDAL